MRNYIRKTERNRNITPQIIRKAARLVKMEKWNIVHAAKEFNIHQRTLSRYCATMTDEDLDSDSTPAFKIDFPAKKKSLVCLVCQEPYSGSTTSWIECGQSKEWAQEKCVSEESVTEQHYWCDNCIQSLGMH
ncbi:uncharacterized protein LOC123473649 [Daphnia magna]|uniref:uncharacterized protein LOC123473649 n=1 Tax=Daphnia magna TaxID=35525 RepID=UPI001E1BB567|nr:uncharacterized protein LOC123473649 [Daphnia magna]XP_045030646.1 uncharacterized protein LOC123473649 [Daphnia magna]